MFFDGFDQALRMCRYRCPKCGCVVWVPPAGYLPRHQSAVATIRRLTAYRLTNPPQADPGPMASRRSTLRARLLGYSRSAVQPTDCAGRIRNAAAVGTGITRHSLSHWDNPCYGLRQKQGGSSAPERQRRQEAAAAVTKKKPTLRRCERGEGADERVEYRIPGACGIAVGGGSRMPAQ